MALALPPASQRQRPASSLVTSRARLSSSARVSSGAAAAYPCVNRSANASSRTSTARGRFGTGGRGARGLGRRHHAAGAAQVAGPDRGPERLQVRVAGQAGVERLQAPGRAEQQPSSVAGASLHQRDQSAQVLHLGSRQRVERPSLDRDQQSQCRVKRAGGALGPGGREQAPGTASGSGRQHRRALQERGRRGQASARLRAAGRALELGGDVLVGPGRGLGPVPGAAVGIDLRIGDLRQGAVDVLPLLQRRRPVGRRAHQRMPEPHAGAEFQQAGLGCRRRRLRGDPEPLGCPPHQHRIADRLGRRELQQPPGVGRKRVQPPPEALLDPPRERHRAGEREPARQLRRRQAPRQLHQRQRVAAGLGDDLVADPRVQRPGQHRVQQRARIGLLQPLDHQLRQPRQLVARNASREDQADRFRRQATRNEPEDLRRGAIEPLLVVHQADQRMLLGDLGQQAQDGQPDQEAVRRRPGTEAERGPQRSALRSRETLEATQHRRAQLVQPGERELHLRLDPGGARHPAARGVLDQVVQQRRLAHARLAAHHQRPGSHPREQLR